MEMHSIKSKIYRMLDELNEEQLFEVNELLTAYLKKTDEDDNWDRLSDEDKAAIEEGIQQIERGEFYTHEEVMEQIHKKFGI